LTSKDGITYQYGENGAGPHAVTSGSDGSSFDYDANGNMISMYKDGVDWDYIYDAENALLNGFYKIDSGAFTGGRTVITLDAAEVIPTVLGVFSGSVQNFTGTTTGMFMIKGRGVGYNLEPQGSVNVAKRQAVVLSGRQNDQKEI